MIYAADNGAQIINLSLGGEAELELLRSAVDYARSRGALVIAAAGNGNMPSCTRQLMYRCWRCCHDENDLRPAF